MTSLTLHFLGTGGGRFVMIGQRRRTAGIRIVYKSRQIHVDPGPGALVFSNWSRLSPQNIEALIITHCHPDHYCDGEVFIEAMTRGGTKRRGILAATRSVLSGIGGIGPSISTYHQDLVERIISLDQSSRFKIDDLRFSTVKSIHSDPDTIGLRIDNPHIGSFGYTSDTGYFPELGNLYKDLRLLILCTMRPRGAPLHFHLSTDDALEIIQRAHPGCVILTHFGIKMLSSNPDAEAIFLEEETGVPTFAARDGMQLTLDNHIKIQGPRKKDVIKIIEA